MMYITVFNYQKKGAAENEIESITDSVDMNLSKLWEIVKEEIVK